MIYQILNIFPRRIQKRILDPNFTPIMGIIFTNNEKIEILQHKDDNNLLKYHKIYNDGKTEQGLFLKDKSVNNVNFSDLKSFHHEEFQSSFCQREEGESQSQCENREYDEFVEDCWVCWIAYHTNPAIPILISAMCLCDK